jgi:phosphohistidine phosphatase SixA
MRLILLRHEKREEIPTFFSKLTTEGLKDSQNIKTILINNIHVIFCSPFERAIQTIQDYCEYTKINLNIENSLYEFMTDNSFMDNKLYNINDIEEKYSKIINYNYKSQFKIEDFENIENNIIIKKETEYELFLRVHVFLNYLFDSYDKYKNSNILIVSHMSTIQSIEKYIYTYIIKKKYNQDFFGMGKLKLYNIIKKKKDYICNIKKLN